MHLNHYCDLTHMGSVKLTGFILCMLLYILSNFCIPESYSQEQSWPVLRALIACVLLTVVGFAWSHCSLKVHRSYIDLVALAQILYGHQCYVFLLK